MSSIGLRILLTLCLSVASVAGMAQHSGDYPAIKSNPTYNEISKYKLILSPGIAWQNGPYAELNLMYAQTANNHMGLGIHGPRLGIETNFKSTDYTFAPKLGYEVSLLFLCLRASAVGYIDGSKNLDLRLLPEAGFSFFGLVNLTYGYGFSLLDHRADVGPNRVALTFNLSRDLWNDIFNHE